jgi:hypothetical protein
VDPFETEIFGVVEEALRSSNLPIRRPSNEQPTFWDYPICPSRIEPVSAAAGWVDFLTIKGLIGTTHRVSGYVATGFGDATLSGLEFRFLFNGTLAPNMDLGVGIEQNKITPSTFPCVRQSTCFLVEESDSLVLQVRNTGVFQQLVCAYLTGWRYNNRSAPDKGAMAVITDDT